MADSTLPTDLAGAQTAADGLSSSLAGLTDLSGQFGRSLIGAFKGAAVQGKDLDQVLRGLASRLADRALDKALAPLAGLIDRGVSGALSGLGGALGFRDGAAFAGGRVVPFADGGVVARPSYFPLAGGGAGLMGEAGAEAIMPLSRGPDGRLGVAAGTTAGSINVSFHVVSPDADSFLKSELQLTGMVARAVGRGRRGL